MFATCVSLLAMVVAVISLASLAPMWVTRRRSLIQRAVRQRFIVTLPRSEGVFAGVLVEHDERFWIFDNCRGIPTHQGETADEWPGRMWVLFDCDPPPYLQEITADAVQKFAAQGRDL
jgi:hypothetical protein